MAKNQQKRDRRTRTEQQRREQEQRARRARMLRTGAIVAGVIVVLAVAVFAYLRLSEDEPVVAPDHVTEQNGVRFPANQSGDQRVEVVVYDDPLCPHCAEFEAEYGKLLRSAVQRGEVALEYRPIAFQDGAEEPLNAAACVLDAAGPQAFQEFHTRYYDDPEADLGELAAESGAEGSAVTDCIESGTHNGWAEQITSQARDDGIEATPTVQIDGADVDPDEFDELETLIEEAR